MQIQNLKTPSLVLEEKILYQNIESMKKLLDGKSLALRPHYKSHKCASLAKLQMQNGAIGMTCAKLSEAIDLAESGIEDILIANQIVDIRKIRRLAELAGDCKLTVCVDNLENVKELSRAAQNAGTTIHCLIEFDIGMKRCGVSDPKQVCILAEQIGNLANLEFAGIQAYAGHLSHWVDEDERKKMTEVNDAKLRDLLHLLETHGMKAKTVSGGSTGTASIKAQEGLYTELQAGSYLFMDATYAELELPFENSLFLLSTVVSKNQDITVVDAGVKTCGIDQGMPIIKDAIAREVVASEEHFQFHGLNVEKRIGQRVLLVPGHCCSTVNLHEHIYVTDNGKVVDRIPITARLCGR